MRSLDSSATINFNIMRSDTAFLISHTHTHTGCVVDEYLCLCVCCGSICIYIYIYTHALEVCACGKMRGMSGCPKMSKQLINTFQASTCIQN